MLLALQLELCRGLALPLLGLVLQRRHKVSRLLRHIA